MHSKATPATRAEAVIRDRIKQHGRITFAEFMELVLYGPDGYYATPRRAGAGKNSDYYTSPLTHPLFGALIALQLEQMWRLLGASARFWVIEPGAGEGRLAQDVAAYARSLEPAFAAALAYVALDQAFAGGGSPLGQRALVRARAMPFRDVAGCIISNELVDALPIHRVAAQGGRLLEAYVTLRDGRLVETMDKPSTPAIAETLEAQGIELEEGWQAEVSLAAAKWMEDAAQCLARGYVITFDYGDLADRLFTRARSRGTLMAYYRHTPQGDPYTRVGRQDLTAHANFTTLIDAGRREGLMPVVLMTQREFLGNLGARQMIERAREAALAQQEHDANVMAMRDLLKPDGLGNFRVLVQAKGAPARELLCLGSAQAKAAVHARVRALPAPLLSPDHIDLIRARYPHLAEMRWPTRS